jgi:hypothetical protein
MSFTFRVRFQLGERVWIESPDRHMLLTRPPGEEIELRPTADVALDEARDLELLGWPYDTEPDATEAARRWRGLLQKALARVNLGADFGDRAPKGVLTQAGLDMLTVEGGPPVLKDPHGILVFESDLKPVVARLRPAKGQRGVPGERLQKAVALAVDRDAVMSECDQLAYDVYSASFSESSADARFVMLWMALETMIDQQPRAEAVRAHVDRMVACTQGSGLPPEEVKSLVGSLEELRKRESINRAGQRFVSRLGQSEYMNEPPKRFFTKCYKLRNGLVHGHDPRPPRADVASRAPHLERFVADLLSIELLDQVP